MEPEMDDSVLADPDRLLYTSEVCALIGMTPKAWHNYVKRGTAPAPDDADLDRPVNKRMPRWKLRAIVEFQHTRKRRKRRAPQEGGADEKE